MLNKQLKYLFTRRKYSKLKKKWGDKPLHELYSNQEFMKRVFDIMRSIPIDEYDTAYQPQREVEVCLDNVQIYHTYLLLMTSRIECESLSPQPTFTMRKQKLVEFLVSKDGRTGRYESAMVNIFHTLERLYLTIWQADADLQDYYYRQLKEALVCGITLCIQHIQGFLDS